jgi:hypothetical protein
VSSYHKISDLQGHSKRPGLSKRKLNETLIYLENLAMEWAKARSIDQERWNNVKVICPSSPTQNISHLWPKKTIYFIKMVILDV